MQNTNLVAIAALVTGISAALSMTGSEYLSTKTEDTNVKDPLRASIYTGIAYFIAVIILVAPYFVLSQIFLALIWTLLNAVLIILIFTFYISVAKNDHFHRRFLEMIAISMGVAAISFGIGILVRQVIGVEV